MKILKKLKHMITLFFLLVVQQSLLSVIDLPIVQVCKGEELITPAIFEQTKKYQLNNKGKGLFEDLESYAELGALLSKVTVQQGALHPPSLHWLEDGLVHSNWIICLSYQRLYSEDSQRRKLLKKLQKKQEDEIDQMFPL